MKKLISLILILVMVVSCMSFAGCNKETTQPETTTTADDGYTPDSTLRILMVGNSFCYYYVEELYELLMENPPEGIEAVEIYNLYYSGCKLDQHLNWWQNGLAKYQLYKTDSTGRGAVAGYEEWTLDNALMMADWDYISLQGGMTSGGYLDDKYINNQTMVPITAEPLLDMFHEKFPHAQLLWHNTWYSEPGRVLDSGYVYTEENGPLYDEKILAISEYMCNEFAAKKPYDLTMVNTGAAWAKARELNKTRDLLPYGGLCARLGYAKFGDMRENSGDGYHDGDIGGAQLLNAYVWYMVITGRTDVSASAYAPVYKAKNSVGEYPLSADLIAMLKEAANSVFQ